MTENLRAGTTMSTCPGRFPTTASNHLQSHGLTIYETVLCTVLLLIIVLSLGIGCQKDTTKASPTKSSNKDTQILALSPQAVKNAGFSTAKAKPAKLQPKIELQGDIETEPNAVAKVVSRVKGVLIDINFKPGDSVKKGEVVAIIQSRELADAAIGFFEAAKNIRFARKAYAREKNLWKKKITAKQDYLETKKQYEQAQLSYNSALQKLRSLGLDKQKMRQLSGRSRRELSRYELKATLSGTVIERNATKGQAVKDDTELLKIADLSQVILSVSVPARYLPFLEKGRTVTVRSKNLKMKTKAKLVYIAPVVDQDTRTSVARARIDNSQGKWRPGLCANMHIPAQALEAKVTVPTGAIVEIDGKPSVFVVHNPNEYELRHITIGPRTEKRVSIKNGLSAGEVVVTKNTVILKSAWQQKGG
jgi:cobalt-zinc-cadmium efflux system membrane fusion protein